MDSKKVIEKLIKIAEKQQKIIEKLAQQAGLPPDSLPTSSVDMSGGHPAPVSAPPPPADLKPHTPKQFGGEGQVIMQALPPNVQAVVNSIQVSSGAVNVSFKAGGATQANYNVVLNAVKQLQASGKLMGSSYKVHVV